RRTAQRRGTPRPARCPRRQHRHHSADQRRTCPVHARERSGSGQSAAAKGFRRRIGRRFGHADRDRQRYAASTASPPHRPTPPPPPTAPPPPPKCPPPPPKKHDDDCVKVKCYLPFPGRPGNPETFPGKHFPPGFHHDGFPGEGPYKHLCISWPKHLPKPWILRDRED